MKLYFVVVLVATFLGKALPERQQNSVRDILVGLMQNEIDNISFVLMEEIVREAIQNPEMLLKMADCISLDGSLEVNDECTVMIIDKVTNEPMILQRILNSVWEHSTMAKKIRSLTKQLLVQARSGELFYEIERQRKYIAKILLRLMQDQNEFVKDLLDISDTEEELDGPENTRILSEDYDLKGPSQNSEDISTKRSNDVTKESKVELN